jgi:Spy/CpxP family protein refolding chaperone
MHRGWKGAALALVTTLALTGSAMAQRGPGGGFGFGPGRGGGARMLGIPEVQAELKLTDDQKTKVNALMEAMRGQRGQFGQGQDLSPEERQKLFAQRRAEENQKVNAILNADQQKRYRQIRLQQQGISAVAEKEVADELKLTADQRSKIQTIQQEQMQSMRSLFQGAGGDFQSLRPKMEAMRKETDEKIAALLTDDQKKSWKEMLGAPFTLPSAQLGA